MSKSLKNKGGFSIIEVLMAVLVLAVGLISVMALMSSNIKNSINSRDQVIASELAQEGVELVRNVRDNNSAKGCFSFLNFPSPSSSGVNLNNCRNDMRLSVASPPCNGVYGYGFKDENCIETPIDYYKLYYKNGYYLHAEPSGTPTKFQRRIMISYFDSSGNATNVVANAAKAVIYSLVSWNNSPPLDVVSNCNTGNKCIVVEDILTDWK